MSSELCLYSDGACLGNPGRGGWSYVLLDQTFRNVIDNRCGAVSLTTNNRMELGAMIKGMASLAASLKTLSFDKLTIISDSQYAIGFFKKTRILQPVNINSDLQAPLRRAIIALGSVQIEAEWIKGHSGDYWNSFCDEQATSIAHSGPWVEDKGYKKPVVKQVKQEILL